jgi:hypothetical protein
MFVTGYIEKWGTIVTLMESTGRVGSPIPQPLPTGEGEK